MLNRIHAAQVSDTRNDDSSNTAGYKKLIKFKRFKSFNCSKAALLLEHFKLVELLKKTKKCNDKQNDYSEQGDI